MKKKLVRFCLVFSIVFPILAFPAPNKTQDKIEFEIFKAKTEEKFEHLKELKNQDLIRLELEVESQNRIIEQLNHQIDWLGHLISYGSVVITVLLLLIGFFAYRNARNDAQKIAKEETESQVEKWFKQNNNQVIKHMNSMERHVSNLRNRLDELEVGIQSEANDHRQSMRAVVDKAIKQGITDNPVVASQELKQAFESAIQDLERKTVATYSYNDWNTKAFAAFHAGKFEWAAEFWGYASGAATNDDEYALSIYNKALVYHPKYLNNPQVGIDTYNILLDKFLESDLLFIQTHVALSLLSKAFLLGKLNRAEEASFCDNEVIKRFSTSTEPKLLSYVANAYCSEGFRLILTAKQKWESLEIRNETLLQALDLLNKSLQRISEKEKGVLLGNIAYANWLLDQKQEVESTLKNALSIGKEHLYKETLNDTETHTVPEDEGFRIIVEKVWAELNKPNAN